MTFVAGEVIITTEWINEEWMHGVIGDRQGMFPVSFVTIIDELPKETAQKNPTQSVQSNDTLDINT